MCIALEGDGVVASARKMIGATKPLEAEPGTIRGDLAIEVGRRRVAMCHSSLSVKIEASAFFLSFFSKQKNKRENEECLGRLGGM